jgi:hypothetical protein
MKFDTWRAFGVAAIYVLTTVIGDTFIYSLVQSNDVADWVSLIFRSIVVIFLSYRYFFGSKVMPTAFNGLLLAAALCTYNFLLGLFTALWSVTQGGNFESTSDMGPVVLVVSLLALVGIPTIVGWYMGKK